MSTLLKPDQFAALLADVARDVAPAEVRRLTLGEQLASHRKLLLAYRKKGYSLEQLATFLGAPQIGIEASPSFLKKYLSSGARKAAKEAAKV